ncbi:LacI family DNA-binding transcriptional regulator [Oceanobacillus timonensis]|uniref:LacI family DNA-binding transcriptional regulator n=1 Tax=Oceanobacillus timonensis TaxID=1926285 RepID=UPI0009B9E2CF|nr:LacI family DNA-binding transcriptional regulator [Oceanobacillus timonensis]
MVSSLDVAKLAGVSQATVSRVLNNSPKVTEKTKKKIYAAIDELGYYPNLIARSLVTNENRTIALISGAINNDFYVETTESIVKKANELGYSVIVYFAEENQPINIFDSIKGSNVSGILLSSIFLEDSLLGELEKSGIPYIFFNRRPTKGGNYVVLDNKKASYLNAKHLIELGHTRIAYISNEFSNISTLYERKLGFDKAMRKYHLDNEKYTRVIDGTEENLKRTIDELIHLKIPPTSIICTTDHMAMISMDYLISKGIQIPEDISLTGFDNNKITAHQAIQLTTVSHNEKYNIGRIAAENLFEMIENPTKENGNNIQIVLEPKLFKRSTTGKGK